MRKIDLINLVLMRGGNPQIQSLDSVGTHPFAGNVSTTLDHNIRLLQEQLEFPFAEAQVVLQPSDTIIAKFGFKYAFRLPQEFIYVIQVKRQGETFLSPLYYQFDTGVIYSNESTLEVRYARFIDNVMEFNSLFAEALVYKCLEDLAISLSLSPQYQTTVARKAIVSYNEFVNKMARDADVLDERVSGTTLVYSYQNIPDREG